MKPDSKATSFSASVLPTNVAAGLREFTRFFRIEYGNDDEMPAEKFHAELEGIVRLHTEDGSS